MILSIVFVLFITAFIGGLAALFVGFNAGTIKLPLIFAGSFLFSVTIIHILPEVFSLSDQPVTIGIFILAGFFLQQFLEFFSSGIEHGHFHRHGALTSTSRFSIVIALVIHSLLEGALLTHDSPFHARHESYTLLFGIIIHKMPAAFALMTTLKTGSGFTVGQWAILLVFALASPIGLALSESILSLSEENLLYLFALVSGSFLHISTTIFVESSPEHRFGFSKMAVSIAGAVIAILAEVFI